MDPVPELVMSPLPRSRGRWQRGSDDPDHRSPDVEKYQVYQAGYAPLLYLDHRDQRSAARPPRRPRMEGPHWYSLPTGNPPAPGSPARKRDRTAAGTRSAGSTRHVNRRWAARSRLPAHRPSRSGRSCVTHRDTASQPCLEPAIEFTSGVAHESRAQRHSLRAWIVLAASPSSKRGFRDVRDRRYLLREEVLVVDSLDLVGRPVRHSVTRPNPSIHASTHSGLDRHMHRGPRCRLSISPESSARFTTSLSSSA